MRGSCEAPKECQSECHMTLDKRHSGLYNYVVVNMRLLSAVITTNQNLYYFSYMREPAAVGFFIIL